MSAGGSGQNSLTRRGFEIHDIQIESLDSRARAAAATARETEYPARESASDAGNPLPRDLVLFFPPFLSSLLVIPIQPGIDILVYMRRTARVPPASDYALITACWRGQGIYIGIRAQASSRFNLFCSFEFRSCERCGMRIEVE